MPTGTHVSQAVAFAMVRRTRLGSCAFGRGNGFIVARHRLPAGVDPDDMLWADDTFRPGAALGRGGNTGCARRAVAAPRCRPLQASTV